MGGERKEIEFFTRTSFFFFVFPHGLYLILPFNEIAVSLLEHITFVLFFHRITPLQSMNFHFAFEVSNWIYVLAKLSSSINASRVLPPMWPFHSTLLPALLDRKLEQMSIKSLMFTFASHFLAFLH